MKIFIDTNIFLDLLFRRGEHVNSEIILNAVSKGIFEGVVLDITLLNIDYVAGKQITNLSEFLQLINENCFVVGGNNKTFQKALELKHKDLEDAMQYISAVENSCEVIISNDKRFYQGELKVITSKDFVNQYLN